MLTDADNSGINGALSFPLAAIGYVTRLASGIFARGWNDSEHSAIEPISDNKSDSQGLMDTSDNTVPVDHNTASHSDLDDEGTNSATADLPNESDALSSKLQESDAKPFHGEDVSGFKRFDTSIDPTDHYYLGANGHGQVFTCTYIFQHSFIATSLQQTYTLV